VVVIPSTQRSKLPSLKLLSTTATFAHLIGTQKLECCSHAQLTVVLLFGKKIPKQNSTYPSSARSKNSRQTSTLFGILEEINSLLVLLLAMYLSGFGINSLDFGWRQLKTKINQFMMTALSA